jgi:hypothetical protein
MIPYISSIMPGATSDVLYVKSCEDDHSNNAAYDSSLDELKPDDRSHTFLWPSTYDCWTNVTTAVHAQALSVNKQVSIVARLSNSKRKVYRCSHWIAAYKKHLKLVRFYILFTSLYFYTLVCLRGGVA